VLTFAHPWLFALLPLPLLIRWLVLAYAETRAALRAPFVRRVAEISGVQPTSGAVVMRRSGLQAWVTALAWITLVAAAARPQYIEEPILDTVPTRDLLLAVDLSGSMDTEDFDDGDGEPVDRLIAVKQVLDEFLQRREGDRVGLIFFGLAPFLQAPFTEDLQVCRDLLDEAQVGMAGGKTMLGDAIGLALHTFEQSDVEQRVLILLTDGNDTGSKVPPAEAAAIARDRGVVIHTVAVGDPTTVGEDQLDMEGLEAVAETTGGRCFSALDREQLAGIYDELDRIEAHTVETRSHRPRHDLFHWLVGTTVVLVFALQVVGLLLGARRRNHGGAHAG